MEKVAYLWKNCRKFWKCWYIYGIIAGICGNLWKFKEFLGCFGFFFYGIFMEILQEDIECWNIITYLLLTPLNGLWLTLLHLKYLYVQKYVLSSKLWSMVGIARAALHSISPSLFLVSTLCLLQTVAWPSSRCSNNVGVVLDPACNVHGTMLGGSESSFLVYALHFSFCTSTVFTAST